MVLLAADVGNDHTVLGLLRTGPDGHRVTAHWRVATSESRTGDEWALLVSGLVAGLVRGVGTGPTGLGDIDGVAMCSAVPAVLHEWREMLATHFSDVPAVLVEPGVRTGLPIRTDNPKEVGADRIANAVAAASLFGGPAIVVDFGTATTFDVIDGQGHYLGGAIAPGIAISLEALGRRGAQLRKVELSRPRTAIARNTVEALQSGMVFGVASQVDGMVARMTAELGVPPTDVAVIATGYLAPVVVEECRCFTEREPWLTLLGLGLIFDRNA